MAINRYELVTRHNPKVTKIDPYAPLSVGNGEFAFTADITGMQTFPEEYTQGIPLCTQSHWGWHTCPADNAAGKYDIRDFQMKQYETGNRRVGYRTSKENQEEAYHWLRMNPHRLNLGKIGLRIQKETGSAAEATDIQDPSQILDLWKGRLNSTFSVEGNQIATQTVCHPKEDMVAFRVESGLLALKRLSIQLSFPYGSPDKTASDWEKDLRHYTEMVTDDGQTVTLQHQLDKDSYFIQLRVSHGVKVTRTGRNSFQLHPTTDDTKMELLCLFSIKPQNIGTVTFDDIAKESEIHWNHYWSNGGMIEFKNSKAPRAFELERRVILSQYLLAVQCAGSLPPQETGLTFNSWYGKFHLEMHWWHGVHFPLWGRAELFEKSLWWYEDILPRAEALAKSQGYRGVRWPKMVSFDGEDSPSPIGPLLIWQQPHPIYYAELLYKTNPNRETLEKYKEIVFKTAEFMASYADYDSERDRYVLGPAVIPAQENHKPQDTLNPTFELEYWAFGLNTANEWRKRLNLEPVAEWEMISKKLAELPVKEKVYLAHENCPDTFTRFNRDHPSMLGALGILPGTKADREIMLNTLKTVVGCWKMHEVWGWDFPMMAMTAARLGQPGLAVDCLLMDAPKNEYLSNGHNKQATRADLPIYLPGNGGLLTAVAMMAAGWEGCDTDLPGFPKDGTWNVAWEGLRPML